MEKTNITVPISTSILLADVLDRILYQEVREEKGVRYIERKLPFKVAYKLARTKAVLDKDVKSFFNYRLALTAQYGEATEDNQNVIITDKDNLDKFNKNISAALATKVTRSIIKIDPEDIESIKEALDVPIDKLQVFIAYLTADQEFFDDFSADISFNTILNN